MSTTPADPQVRPPPQPTARPGHARLLAKRLARSRDASLGCDEVARALRKNGIGHLFTVPGVPVYEALRASIEKGIRVVGTRHQFTAATAAAAFNLVRGSAAAATIVSAEPAEANLFPGLHYAQVNGLPLVALGGRRRARSPLAGEFQGKDLTAWIRPAVKGTATIEHAREIHERITSALQQAVSGIPGAVYLSVFEETLAERTRRPAQIELTESAEPSARDSGEIGRLIDLFRTSERPALVVGHAARWNGAPDAIRRWVESTGCACLTTPTARGIIPDSHPLLFNSVADQVQGQADLIILVGADLDWQLRFGSMIPATTPIVMIGAPAPETANNRPVHLSIQSPLRPILQQLCLELAPGDSPSAAKNRAMRRQWTTDLRNRADNAELMLRRAAMKTNAALTTERLLFEIRDFLSSDAITVFDANESMLAAQKIIPCEVPGHRLTAGTNGTMGVGIPLAIGAGLARPETQVLAICGDFSVGFSCGDFETAVRHNVPILVVVVENGGISAGQAQRLFLSGAPDIVGASNPKTRFDALARAFGGHGEYVDHPHAVRPALERAVQSGLPAILHAKTQAG